MPHKQHKPPPLNLNIPNLNILIVGAGIAGLSAGIYARKSGFDVTIYESHNVPGGNCTGWRRKGYLFEAGLHWLTGSGADKPLNRIWRETGALTDETRIDKSDPFRICDRHGLQVCLYRDVTKLEAHLCAVSPEDRPRIRQLCRDIIRFSDFSVPVVDIPLLKTTIKAPSVFTLIKMLPAVLRYLPLSTLSVTEYAAKFKHPAIRLLLTSVVNPHYEALSLLVTLGCLASGDGGYIEGGSLVLAANMARRFEALGGTIHYGKKVEKVLVTAGKVFGLAIGGETVPADACIVTVDTLSAIDVLFDPPIREGWARRMRAKIRRPGALIMCSFISIGVETDLSGFPESIVFPLENPFDHAGQRITELAYKLYYGSAGYAPPGCSAITILLAGDTYDYWKQMRDAGRYDDCKRELFEQILGALEKQLPIIKGKVAVWDVATPLTYERYCGTYHGSWMTLTKVGGKRDIYPGKSKRIGNLYFAGQRTIPPGGTPVAVSTGRTAAQYLCRDFGAVFTS